MPRFPTRTEPYTSPTRQHRHYKNKRDQILRALGKAAYINGSQFAILWVSAQGKVETYASDLLQDKLSTWFPQDSVLEPARKIVLDNQSKLMREDNNRRASIATNTSLDLDFMEFSASTDGEDGTMVHGGEELSQDPALEPIDSNLGIPACEDGPVSNRIAPSMSAESFDTVATSAPSSIGGFSIATEDSNVYTPMTVTSDLSSACPVTTGPPPEMIIPVATTSITPSGLGVRSISFNSADSVSVFIQSEFSNLQQLSCKIVAKLWIKVIEPKKQTKFPYQKGEKSKPDWWPREIRHKEPDHLKKDERITLLETMLRSGRVPVSRLSLATAEAVAFIPAEKMSILRDIYKVAEAEEYAKKVDPLLRNGFTVVLQNQCPVPDTQEEFLPPKDAPKKAVTVGRQRSVRTKQAAYEPYSLRTRTKATQLEHSASPPDTSISRTVTPPVVDLGTPMGSNPHPPQMQPTTSAQFMHPQSFAQFAPVMLEHTPLQSLPEHQFLTSATPQFEMHPHDHLNPFLTNSQFHGHHPNQEHPQAEGILQHHSTAPYPSLNQSIDWSRYPMAMHPTQPGPGLFNGERVEDGPSYYRGGTSFSEVSSANDIHHYTPNFGTGEARGSVTSAHHSPEDLECNDREQLGAPFEFQSNGTSFCI